MNNLPAKRILGVPRGMPGLNPLELEMDLIDEAERRLHEVRLVNTATRTELAGLFNQAANACGKYMAWVEYEILRATKQYNLDRATVILDQVPEHAKAMKEAGMKMNEDHREALIMRDPACSESLDRLNSLKAVKALLESHHWSFIRAHGSTQEVAQQRGISPTPNFSGAVGQTHNIPQMNFMGKDERKE